MAFLGIISLVGLIVSHIIVLFDFIEEKHAEGEPLRRRCLMQHHCVYAGVDNGTRFSDCACTLALRGGPLWEPMCYAQMGGMLCATFITLLLVCDLFDLRLDLKLIKWKSQARRTASSATRSCQRCRSRTAQVTVTNG